MRSDQEVIEQVSHALSAGAAVLFAGAGFSRGTPIAGSEKTVPSTDELTSELKELLGVPKEEEPSLSEVAEFANEVDGGKQKINSYLIQRLTSTIPTEDQRWLVERNWRSIFTTNFDDIIEQVRVSARVPVTPASESRSISASLTPIYYLHGRALDLREADIDPSMVLSETNYLKLEKSNRDLYAKLFNEIACARAIVLVGYSLRDLQIASGFLKSGGEVRDKTVIITGPNDSDFTKSRLRKFGHVLSVGSDGFVEKLRACSIEPGETDLQFLREQKLVDAADVNEAEDFLTLILRGEVEPANFLRQKVIESEPYCIERSHVKTLLDASVGRFIVSSDFGNGKSAFLYQASVALLQRGYRVFWIDTRLPEINEEIERVLATGQPVAFLIDDVLRYRTVAAFAGQRLHGQALLIATTRGDQDFRFEEIASKLGGAYRTIDLNVLDNDEIADFDRLLERWGYWESKAGATEQSRIEFLREECSAEVRSIVLALFEESKIAETIDRIVEFFLRTNDDLREPFAGLLISSLCQKHVTWTSIVSWLDIDEEKLRSTVTSSDISFLFRRGRDWNLFTSAQLADFILTRKFVEEDRDLLVKCYSEIVLRTADSANDYRSGWDFEENLKELMKFRFLRRLFGNTEASAILIGQVYRKLSNAPRIRNNPQFWLQYAMSRMEIDDLEGAERYIKTALSKAKARGADYSPFQIIDQRARLFLMKNARNRDYYSEGEVRDALQDLYGLLDDRGYDVVYAMRSMPLIEGFLEVHIDNVTPDIRERLTKLLGLAKEKASEFDRFPRSQKGETRVLKKALSDAQLVLFNG
ncbi:SIR2 family protein [Parerythrobacter jejuensis]|uniref:SIR2-like domain-containing protein n=1 Tax=Parerythrobacter jejuensis TaxID=795812 RepID=A0A845AQV9_9SPHN|nr:SIR2 family protein [Parerythrobacter jejuensis]MXP32690.1 hypothetical protein [Parerythrobacter jejuensis]